ncbi:MAG: hypothetical protein ACOCW9_01150 [Thermodesulfobacteriota bacterium]
MLKPASRKITYEDIEALPENLIGEIIDGELIAVPRPSYLHSHVASSLTEAISGPFQKGKGGRVHGENECIRAEPFQAAEIALEHLWWE